MKYCTNCGSQLSDSDKFCSNCGQSTSQSSNDDTVKADIKVEVINTNTDKAVKVAKKIIEKNPKSVKWYIFIFCFLVIGFIPIISQ